MIWLALLLGSVGAGWLLGHGDAAANLRSGMAIAPACGLIALMGVTIGLYGRDRIRLRRSYASPSLAYLGKTLLFGSLSPMAAWLFAPVAWPPDVLKALAAGCAAGIAVWLGNLPSRL